jgi:hypothetical protein
MIDPIIHESHNLIIPSKNMLWSEVKSFQAIPTRNHLINGEVAPLLLYIKFKNDINNFHNLISRVKIANNSLLEAKPSQQSLLNSVPKFIVNPSSTVVNLLSDLPCILINSLEDNASKLFIVSKNEVVYQINFPVSVQMPTKEVKICIKLTANLMIESNPRDLSNVNYSNIKYKISQNKSTQYQELFTVEAPYIVHDCFKWLSMNITDTLKNELVISLRFEHSFCLENIGDTAMTINEIEFAIPESKVQNKIKSMQTVQCVKPLQEKEKINKREKKKEKTIYILKHYNCFESKIYNSLPEKIYYKDEYNVVISIKPLLLPDSQVRRVNLPCDACKNLGATTSISINSVCF